MPAITGSGAVPLPREGRQGVVVAAAIVVLICVLIYLYPWMATRAAIGKTPLPPNFASDQSTYMVMGKMIHEGATVDPWYGLNLAGVSLPYHTFSLSLISFDAWRALHHGNWYWASFTWDIAWIALTCAALWFLMRKIFPESDSWVTASAVLFLLLVATDWLPVEVRAWLHLGRGGLFGPISLPLGRMYYPQTILAPACLYAALLISALRHSTIPKWTAMVLLQFLLLWAFPYAALWVALATGICLLASFASEEKPRLAVVLAFAAACAVVDLAFLYLHSHGATAGGPVFAIQLGMVRELAGGSFILICVLSVLLLLLRRDTAVIALVSLAMADATLLLGDAVFANQLQFTSHAGYFVQVVIGLLLMTLLFEVALKVGVARIAAVAVALIAVVNGAAVAHGNYRLMLSANSQQAELQRAVTSVAAGAQDLLVLPAAYVDDAATWAPLITSARVLYAPNAELVMPPTEKERLHSERQSMYLFLRGVDKQWVESVLAKPGSTPERSLEMLNERALVAGQASRAATVEQMRRRLEPRLDALATAEPWNWMKSYRKVIVLDSASAPVFDAARLNHVFQITAQQVTNGVIVREVKVR